MKIDANLLELVAELLMRVDNLEENLTKIISIQEKSSAFQERLLGVQEEVLKKFMTLNEYLQENRKSAEVHARLPEELLRMLPELVARISKLEEDIRKI